MDIRLVKNYACMYVVFNPDKAQYSNTCDVQAYAMIYLPIFSLLNCISSLQSSYIRVITITSSRYATVKRTFLQVSGVGA